MLPAAEYMYVFSSEGMVARPYRNPLPICLPPNCADDSSSLSCHSCPRPVHSTSLILPSLASPFCSLTSVHSPPLPPPLSSLHLDHTHASIAWTCLHIRHLTNFWRNSQLQWKKEGRLASSSGTGAATGLDIIVHNAPYFQYLQAPSVACILRYL